MAMNRKSLPLRTLVVDDEPLAREGMAALLAEDPEIASIEEAGDVGQALQRIRGGDPHIVFLDVEMPEDNGFSILSAVGSYRIPSIVFVTAHERYAVRAFDKGAADYVLKP